MRRLSRATGPETRARASNIIVISAPSGTGKSTVVKRVVASVAGLGFAVSHTTRAPRPGEQNGREYFFVEPARFKRMVAAEDFVEWANVYGHLYGTTWNELRHTLEGGKDVVLDIDVQGHSQVRRRLPEALSVFLLPPSFTELARRLRRRHSDSAEVIESRLAMARKEISHWSEYDYLIVNDRISTAVQAVKTVVLAARFRRQRQQGLVEDIRKTFGGRSNGRTAKCG
jgi:guanylate kinase